MKKQRIVVKIGTQVLTKADGNLDEVFIKDIVQQIVTTRRQDIEVILVTSGAVAAGRGLSYEKLIESIRNETIQRQVLAGAGQPILMGKYRKFFAEDGCIASQVLATKEDFRDEEHYITMQDCLEGFLSMGIIPIVNENDTVAVTELMFTDNDELAGLIASQLAADSLIILTTTDGILDRTGKTISHVHNKNTKFVNKCVTSNKTNLGRGGMFSKLKTGKLLMEQGISTYIVNGREEQIISRLIAGENIGTCFMPRVETEKRLCFVS